MIKIGLYVNKQVWRWELPDAMTGGEMFRFLNTLGARLHEALSVYYPSLFYPGRNRR